MTGLTGHVLTYFALLGLIFTCALATVGNIGNSISYQYSRLAYAIAGADGSPALIKDPNIDRLLKDLMPPQEGPNQAPTDSDEDLERWNRVELRRLQNHFSRMEHLGGHISEKISGDK